MVRGATVSTDTKANVEAAAARVAAAKAEFEAAKLAHARAFRTALVALCNEHGFTLAGIEYEEGAQIVETGDQVTEDDFSFSG